jgi:hypothetical protein
MQTLTYWEGDRPNEGFHGILAFLPSLEERSTLLSPWQLQEQNTTWFSLSYDI